MILVLTVLPSLLVLFDPIITRKRMGTDTKEVYGKAAFFDRQQNGRNGGEEQMKK